MATLARRRVLHAATGAVLAGAVADAVWCSARGEPGFDAMALGSTGELTHGWGAPTATALALAEDLLRGVPLPIDVAPHAVAPAAARFAAVGDPAPLLADPDAASVFDAVWSAAVGAGGHGEPAASPWDPLPEATTFAELAARAVELPHELAVVAGALHGARHGPSTIPSRWLATVAGQVSTNRYTMNQCRALAERLAGADRTPAPDPLRRLRPAEVAPGLWLTDIRGVEGFLADHPDAALVSLCRTHGMFGAHRPRREFIIADVADRDANPHLDDVLTELVDTIDAFHDEGHEVLVHCRYGHSRTGLALRAWLMRHESLAEPEATVEAEARWPHVTTWNVRFTEALARRTPGA